MRSTKTFVPLNPNQPSLPTVGGLKRIRSIALRLIDADQRQQAGISGIPQIGRTSLADLPALYIKRAQVAGGDDASDRRA